MSLTGVQLHDARVLIPGAYEPAAPPQHDTTADLRPRAAAAVTPYVIEAPAHSTTRLGRAAAILGDVALITAVLFVAVLAPVLVVKGINAVAALVLDTWAR